MKFLEQNGIHLTAFAKNSSSYKRTFIITRVLKPTSEMSTDNRRALAPINNGGFKPNQERERLRTVTAFFIFGTLIYATYSLVIAGAQDILAGTFIQTSMVLVADIGPYFFVTLIAPYFMQKIPYFARITTVFLSGIGGFVVLSFANQVHWKLIGVGIASFGYGVGEVTFLALTSFYHEVTLSAYSAGTGAGFVIAPLYYTGMSVIRVYLFNYYSLCSLSLKFDKIFDLTNVCTTV